MLAYLWIAIAGGIGCVCRFGLAQTVQRWLGLGFPYGILIVNVLGCWFIGFLATWLIMRSTLGPLWRTTILIGFLGGFTTFSSFTLDTVNLWLQGNHWRAFLYVVLSVIMCLLATWSGTALGSRI